MVEPTMWLVEHGYHVKRVRMKKGGDVALSLTLTKCPISDEQTAKLLNILDKAAEEVVTVMNW